MQKQNHPHQQEEGPKEAVVRTNDFIRDTEKFLDDTFDGKPAEIPEPRIRLEYGGSYKGRRISPSEFQTLLQRNLIRVSKSFTDKDGNQRMNYLTTDKAEFTGLYRVLRKR